jgi:hypothetical protein
VLAALAVLAIGSPAGADLVPTLVWCAVFGVITVWAVRAAPG